MLSKADRTPFPSKPSHQSTDQVGVTDAHVREGVDDVVLDRRVFVGGEESSKSGHDFLGHIFILKAHLGKGDYGQGLEPKKSNSN